MIQEREHRHQIFLREEEKKKKAEEYARQTQKLLEDQQRQVEEKKKKMEQQEAVRLQKFAQQNEERKRIARELQEYHNKKIEMAKAKNEELIEKQRQVIHLAVVLRGSYTGFRSISGNRSYLRKEDRSSRSCIEKWSLRSRDRKESEI